MDEMKKCTQCGTELPGDALFCPDCGARQSAASAPDATAVNAGSTASYDPFAARPTSSPAPSVPVQPPSQPVFQPAAPSTVQTPPSAVQTPLSAVQTPLSAVQTPPQAYQQAPPSTFQPTPAYQPQPVAPSTQTPPPAAGFQYATPNQQQGVPNPYTPQPGMPGGIQQPYPPQSGPMATPIVPLVKPAKKIPIFLLVVSGMLAIGLIFWLFRFFNPNLVYSFGDPTSKGVVFALILMSVIALLSTVVLRYQLRGKKLAILANVILVLIVIVLLFGISITEFINGDLPYNLFINLVPR